MSPTKEELQDQWARLGNGFIHALWASIPTSIVTSGIMGGLSAGHVISDSSAWIGLGSAILAGFVNAVVGFMRDNGNKLPDVFATRETVVVTKTVEINNEPKE